MRPTEAGFGSRTNVAIASSLTAPLTTAKLMLLDLPPEGIEIMPDWMWGAIRLAGYGVIAAPVAVVAFAAVRRLWLWGIVWLQRRKSGP